MYVGATSIRMARQNSACGGYSYRGVEEDSAVENCKHRLGLRNLSQRPITFYYTDTAKYDEVTTKSRRDDTKVGCAAIILFLT